MSGRLGSVAILVVTALLGACGQSARRGGSEPHEGGRGGSAGASATGGTGGASGRGGSAGGGGSAGKSAGGSAGAQAGGAAEGGDAGSSPGGSAGADTGGNGGQTGGGSGGAESGASGSATSGSGGESGGGAAGIGGGTGAVVYRACSIDDQAIPRLSLFRADEPSGTCLALNFELYSGGGCALLESGSWCLYSAHVGSDVNQCLRGSAPSDGVAAVSASGSFTVRSSSIDATLSLAFPEGAAATAISVDVSDCTSECTSESCGG